MREIVLDTETTGISPADGHRVVEIGAIELENHMPTGRVFHCYLNPERDMPAEAAAIHGLTLDFLKDKPLFASMAQEFADFIADATLVIHNASFDVGFLNAELAAVKRDAIDFGSVVDTLQIARRKHPMASNSLDALCRRYGVDNTKRTKHGALLDAELLAEVYVDLLGGRQRALDLASAQKTGSFQPKPTATRITARPEPLPPRLTPEESADHDALVRDLGPGSLWSKPN